MRGDRQGGTGQDTGGEGWMGNIDPAMADTLAGLAAMAASIRDAGPMSRAFADGLELAIDTVRETLAAQRNQLDDVASGNVWPVS
jgi:hypothetical protein